MGILSLTFKNKKKVWIGFLVSDVFQEPLTQSDHCAKVSYFGLAYSATLHQLLPYFLMRKPTDQPTYLTKAEFSVGLPEARDCSETRMGRGGQDTRPFSLPASFNHTGHLSLQYCLFTWFWGLCHCCTAREEKFYLPFKFLLAGLRIKSTWDQLTGGKNSKFNYIHIQAQYYEQN